MVVQDEAPAAAAPWESVPSHEQLFVLITGANSGVGLGTGKRLIDEFLSTRSLSAHLILLPTTRSAAKSRQTVGELRAHATLAAQTSPALRARYGTAYRWQDAAARVHVLSLPLDLCDLRGVKAFARRLSVGRVANPDGLEGLRDVRVPRLDAVVFNAAYGGWAGCDYPMAAWSMLTKGLIQSATWPDFKKALPTGILNEQQRYGYPAEPLLGEVFVACVFGHYVLAHELLPLLRRPAASPVDPGRIIWTSSLEAVRDSLSVDDLQCLCRPDAYESAKRLTDVLALTHSLPAARPFSSRWLGVDHDDGDDEKPVLPPKVYLTHPGIVASTIFPLPWFLLWAYRLVLVLSRWFGSPWHTVDGYSGAKAAAWVVLEDQEALDALDAERIKWGSSSDRHLHVDVKKTEVEGWGWEGKVEDAHALAANTLVGGVLHKLRGRKHGVVDVTDEDIVQFEEQGARCWKDMEELRTRWEKILDRDE